MIEQSETLKRAMEALNSISVELTEDRQAHSLAKRAPETVGPTPVYDPEEWRKSLKRWMTEHCLLHRRLSMSVSGLHVAFSEWGRSG